MVCGARLERLKPAANVRPARWIAERPSLIVEERRVHTLDIWHKYEVGCRWFAAATDPRAGSAAKLGVETGGDLLERLLPHLLLLLRAAWIAQPLAPRPKKLPLHLALRCDHRHWVTQRAKRLLERVQDDVRFGDEFPIELDRRQHARRYLALVPGLLLPIAEHGDLGNAVGHTFLLLQNGHTRVSWCVVFVWVSCVRAHQPQPDLLAVRAPSVVVPEECDSYRRLWMSMKAEQRLRVGRTVCGIWWRELCAQWLDLRPSQCPVHRACRRSSHYPGSPICWTFPSCFLFMPYF